ARNVMPGMARLTQPLTGISAKRQLPAWRRDVFGEASAARLPSEHTREVALVADTFNRNFEPENLHPAAAVLGHPGYPIGWLRPGDGDGASGRRPLCCGRTFLSAGLVDEARAEARRLLAAAAPFVARGVCVVGLEPACLLTLRDEFLSLLPGVETEKLAGAA